MQDSLRKADWGRADLENVIKFTLNGACDSETFEKIERMSSTDQDRFRGSKFFLLCLVHGMVETAQAMEAAGSDELLQKKVISPICASWSMATLTPVVI